MSTSVDMFCIQHMTCYGFMECYNKCLNVPDILKDHSAFIFGVKGLNDPEDEDIIL
jgi:hypothetical protein